MRIERDSSGEVSPKAEIIVTDEIQIFEPWNRVKRHKFVKKIE
ncbi:hypothetical protein PRUB_a5265 [Pseudoalteromonas rubra]|uniref:Uncharacterized protein n=1 Tax=Pseudoalteromonas rubra TaxID=43658 RepID=A0A8T0C3W7_9GAMM|nr:hypothetical protein PRUB_a5265 [Pseudoalteromonas rubra]